MQYGFHQPLSLGLLQGTGAHVRAAVAVSSGYDDTFEIKCANLSAK